MAFKQTEYLINKKYYFHIYLLQIQAIKKKNQEVVYDSSI